MVKRLKLERAVRQLLIATYANGGLEVGSPVMVALECLLPERDRRHIDEAKREARKPK